MNEFIDLGFVIFGGFSQIFNAILEINNIIKGENNE